MACIDKLEYSFLSVLWKMYRVWIHHVMNLHAYHRRDMLTFVQSFEYGDNKSRFEIRLNGLRDII